MDTAPKGAAPRDPDPHVTPARYITADIPGIGGHIKERAEDFLVDELPLYQPCGEGEHIYMLVEKRGMSTFDMLREVAKHFGVSRSAVSYAGLKDKHAITRQVVSVHVPGKRPEDFPMLRHERIAVMWTDLHTNKLRPGHLAGNRFSIRIRGVAPTDVVSAKRVLDTLEREGVPNRFGEQRFGHLENNHLIGRAIVLMEHQRALDLLLGPNTAHPEAQPESRIAYHHGDYDTALDFMPPHLRTEIYALRRLRKRGSPSKIINGLDHTTARYYLSALQSAVFNAVLDARVVDGTWNRVIAGDLAMLENRAVFAVDEASAADPDTIERNARHEIGPSGPMFGPKMTDAAGAVRDLEYRALDRLGMSAADFSAYDAKHSGMISGSRRPLRVTLGSPDIEGGMDEHGPFVRVAFDLPRGSFATTVLREIIKPAADRPALTASPDLDDD